ncbi:MAG: CDP-diacylglycerol--glycerol-3-phosphate 3-phosphatidyltransferase [Actinomycetota bacterium]|nr:CDP-diacylglycerol--glycerol-3-phosphate 3-phosphatidyltransferase [Actinomycetota bacterium]
MLNIPNSLTALRLLLIILFMYAALAESFQLRWVAAIALGIAAITDWLDGYAARALGQVTEFGKVFDPLVDRLLIASALIVLYMKIGELMPLWAVLIVIGRDVIMVSGWLYMNHIGKRMRVKNEGKLATAMLMLSVFLLMLSLQFNSYALQIIGVLIFYAGLIGSVTSACNYVKTGITTIKSNHL